MRSRFPQLHLVDHPLIQDAMARLRDKNCPHSEFRSLLHKLSLLISYEALRTLPLKPLVISTPLAQTQASILAGPPPTIVPVLRAGLGMADALIEFIPDANVGHIGIYRDHDTKEAIEYLVRLPPNNGQIHIITDPMLATGNSLIHTCNVLNNNTVESKNIIVVALVAAPEGVSAFTQKYPDIPIYCAALDDHLDKNAYIVPGLGDAGDRIFGT